MKYKEVVGQIKDLNWQSLDGAQLQRLMYISHVSAVEFAAALRIALRVHHKDAQLVEMAAGELKADNLAFSDYQNRRGDHAEFLAHFLHKAGFSATPELEAAAERYLERCGALDERTRAMSIFSREHELGNIFAAILQNTHWTGETLEAFRYYLARHIELDGSLGGHAEQIGHYPIDDSVLPFYEARLDFYRVIPELFAKATVAG